MNDYRGTPLKVGDKVAIYWGYNELQGGIINQIRGNKAKVEVLDTVSKWKSGSCMVKLED
ncbi:hypothetical protein CB7_56 [Pectobacterium phage vB_PatM_CB7]|nr:hypothetical protein CB7_56 [Pectobacterium phage vB_PatM_CB7]